MTNIFLGSESMEHQLSNALSTMFLRHLVLFLHFETYALPNRQKKAFSGGSWPQLDFLPHIYICHIIVSKFLKDCNERFQTLFFMFCSILVFWKRNSECYSNRSEKPTNMESQWNFLKIYVSKEHSILRKVFLQPRMFRKIRFENCLYVCDQNFAFPP